MAFRWEHHLLIVNCAIGKQVDNSEGVNSRRAPGSLRPVLVKGREFPSWEFVIPPGSLLVTSASLAIGSFPKNSKSR